MDEGVTAELPPSLIPLRGSDPDTMSGLASRVGKASVRPLHPRRETALEREGQADGSYARI